MIYKFIKSIRAKLLVFLTHTLALPILKLIRKPERFPYTSGELHKFPSGSMGKALILYLEERKLSLLPYYAKHDIKHILLDYDTTEEGEVCLQCFMLGNGHVSFPVLSTVLYGFFLMPEYWSLFLKAYQKGKKANKIYNWPWYQLLGLSLNDIKQNISSAELSKPI
ncbi:MAG TPA: Coq4 family protein [Chitinophagaceae bacterium]|nr:Coq4 family protein [Chitinophagaceae bacterium]